MKIAFSTLGCPEWSWEDIYSMAKDTGFDGIELRGTFPKADGLGVTPAVVAIEAGAFHSLALTSDGQTWAWGLNTDGLGQDGQDSSWRDTRWEWGDLYPAWVRADAGRT